MLNQYIEEQASLTIGYADNNGGVSQKLIDPISISLGTLVARDHATGEVAYFRIPRITGVAPAME
jgi:predicted DNA-binding transcriptional regulator YafY